MNKLLIISTALLAGCATQELRTDITKLERSLGDLRALQAEQTDSLASLDAQVKSMAGRLEEMEFSQNRRIGTDLSALKSDMSSLKRRVPPPSIVPAEDLESDELAGNAYSDDTKGLFLDALQLIREGRFADATSMLRSVSDLAVDKEHRSTALYWLGIANEGISNDRDLFEITLEVVSLYPRTRRAPSALLRQGQVLARIGDKKTATLSFERIVGEYPKSPEAMKARDRLR